MGYGKWTDEEEQLVDPINTLDWIRGMSGKYRRKPLTNEISKIRKVTISQSHRKTKYLKDKCKEAG